MALISPPISSYSGHRYGTTDCDPLRRGTRGTNCFSARPERRDLDRRQDDGTIYARCCGLDVPSPNDLRTMASWLIDEGVASADMESADTDRQTLPGGPVKFPSSHGWHVSQDCQVWPNTWLWF